MDFLLICYYDVDKDEYFVARDHGYYSIIWVGSTWNFYVASELKALKDIAQKFNCPGHYMTSSDGELYNGTKESGLIMML
jgi:asparagine synthetase B (glutamine-hydrolysing)